MNFVSEVVIEAEKLTREQAWNQMKLKLEAEGKAIPEKQLEEGQQGYDGRTLWEKLQEHKDKKQEDFDEKTKFSNQFRSLDEDETNFLSSLADDNFEQEDKKRELIASELNSFRRAVLERAQSNSLLSSGNATASTSTLPATPTINQPAEKVAKEKKGSNKKRDFQKSFLKGVIVKKKDLPSATAVSKTEAVAIPLTQGLKGGVAIPDSKLTQELKEGEAEAEGLDGKRRKLAAVIP